MDRIGITKQVVQVSKNFLISTCQKNTERVCYSLLERVHPQCIFGTTVSSDKIVDPPIRITGDIFERCIAGGFFIQTMQRDNRKHLVNSPGVGHRLENRKIAEIFIPGPAGRLEAKYFKSEKNTSPIALVLQPHPQYGGTMNNKVVVEIFNMFIENNFSVCRVNFRGVGKSDGEFDNGQGELADAAAALDWVERENFDNSQCWISGFSFGSLIAMQLLMRRPEINRFIAISPQPNVYDFSFLSPCPTSGLMVYGNKDELVPLENLNELNKKLTSQKGIKVEFQSIPNANHFFTKSENLLIKTLNKYIKKETTLF